MFKNVFKKKIIFAYLALFVFTILSVSMFGKLIDDKMSDYVTEEVNKVSKILIRKILEDNFWNDIVIDDLFIVNKNESGEIELIDLNTKKVNEILWKSNNVILYYFNEFDKGNVELINKYSDVFNRYMTGEKSGLYINVPLGIAFSNPILFSIGPSIPVKILLSGQIESEIVTNVKQYGINSILFEIRVKIRVCEKIIFPFCNRYVDVELEMPLVVELISGKVPENYLNNQKSDIIE